MMNLNLSCSGEMGQAAGCAVAPEEGPSELEASQDLQAANLA